MKTFANILATILFGFFAGFGFWLAKGLFTILVEVI